MREIEKQEESAFENQVISSGSDVCARGNKLVASKIPWIVKLLCSCSIPGLLLLGILFPAVMYLAVPFWFLTGTVATAVILSWAFTVRVSESVRQLALCFILGNLVALFFLLLNPI